jgi:18S rRNA (guanine1575-N7)-methyltransferase
MRFFSSLYLVLKRSARAVLQFYPQNPEQAVLISTCASRVGFAGGLVVDFPNSAKAKKYYLCLSFESGYKVPSPLDSKEGVEVLRRARIKPQKKKLHVKSREWILQKKERDRKRGKDIRVDTKYTGRRRKHAF